MKNNLIAFVFVFLLAFLFVVVSSFFVFLLSIYVVEQCCQPYPGSEQLLLDDW